MMHDGYIKLYRTLRSQPWYNDSEAVHLFVHLLIKASHTGRQVLLNGKPFELQPGQLVTGRKALMLETGIHESKVQRLLKTFENCSQIEQQTNSKNRVITMLSWAKFQAGEQQTNSQRTATEQPANSQRTHNKNERIKEGKEGGENGAPLFPRTIEFEMMKRIGKPAAQMWEQGQAAQLFTGAERQRLAIAWMEVRCNMQRPIVSQVELTALAKLMNAHSPEQLQKLIEYSAGKYPDLYPDRLKKMNAKTAPSSKIIDPKKFDKYRNPAIT